MIPINQLNEDQLRFLQLSRRLKKHLGISPASKGMMDLLELCCDKMEELKKDLNSEGWKYE